MSLTGEERTALLADLRDLWLGWSDLRFGQMLRIIVGDDGVRKPDSLPDAVLAEGLERAIQEEPGRPAEPGPYWDTESAAGRTFVNGLPRDPARIPVVLDALDAAWSAHPSVTFGELIARAMDRSGLPENEFSSRLLLVEDAALRHAFADRS